MKFVIDNEQLKEKGIDMPMNEILLLASLYFGKTFYRDNLLSSLNSHGLMRTEVDNNGKYFYTITQDGVNLIESIFLHSEVTEKNSQGEDRFVALAEKLIELYPKGKKPGTTQPWRSSVLDISSKLKSLYKRGLTFTDKQAIEATSKYVKSFKNKGDYTFMATLKYFICKAKNEDGVAVVESKMMSLIEDETSVDETIEETDWISQLR